MKKRTVSTAAFVLIALAPTAGCSLLGGDEDRNVGPWLGDWLLVNFLTDDGGGEWEEDDLGGLGLVSEISETAWVLANDEAGGCEVTFSYRMNGMRYVREVTARDESCGSSLPIGTEERGRLEFSAGEEYMEEYFEEDGDLVAFRWKRR